MPIYLAADANVECMLYVMSEEAVQINDRLEYEKHLFIWLLMIMSSALVCGITIGSPDNYDSTVAIFPTQPIRSLT